MRVGPRASATTRWLIVSARLQVVLCAILVGACSGPVVETVTEPLIDGPTEGRACRSAEDEGRLAEAEAACQRALEAARRSQAGGPSGGQPGGQAGVPSGGSSGAGSAGATSRKGPDPAAQAYSMRLYNLARVKRKLGRYAEAEALYRRSIEVEEGVSGATSTWVGRRQIELAITLGQQGRWVEGSQILERALPIAARLPTQERATTARVAARFIEALRAAGQTGPATKLERAVAGAGVTRPVGP